MANITDPTAVAFCNQHIRPSADRLMQFYWWCKELKVAYLANPTLATNIPNDPLAVVIDGSATDGRNIITGADVQTLLTNLNSLIVTLEANSSLILNNFAKIAVNIR